MPLAEKAGEVRMRANSRRNWRIFMGGVLEEYIAGGWEGLLPNTKCNLG